MSQKIAIQGQKGSFHHQAAKKFFSEGVSIIACNSFREVFETLAGGQADKAIVALENSLYGSLNENYDHLLKYKPTIIGEIYLHISFDLLSVSGSTPESIKDIYSHPAALGECKEYLHKNLPWAKQHEYNDTAGAAQFVFEQNDKSKAAIASPVVHELYDLESIDEGVDDNEHNYTRFAVISMEEKTVIEASKTSIILPIEHKPGALFSALQIFADRKINLSKIESRPIPGRRDWKRVFYLDFECSDKALRDEAISELNKLGNEIIVLGNYKQGEMPEIA